MKEQQRASKKFAQRELGILKFASATHAAPCDATKKRCMEAYDFAFRIRLELRAEGEGRADASHQNQDDEYDYTCCDRYSVAAVGNTNMRVDGEEHT